MNTGPSIPFGNFSSKNANKSVVIADYNHRKVLAGFNRKESGFASVGWYSNASIGSIFKQKLGISLSGGVQKNGAFNTQVGPCVGWCVTDFPNFEREYFVNGQSNIVTHRIKEKALKALEYGVQIRQIYDINKNLHVGLNASLNFLGFKYTISPRAVGADAVGTYDDILKVKTINLGILAGYFF